MSSPNRARRIDRADGKARGIPAPIRPSCSTESAGAPMGSSEAEPMSTSIKTSPRTEDRNDPPRARRRALVLTGRSGLGASLERRLESLGVETDRRTDPRRAAQSGREEAYDLLVIDDSFPISIRESVVSAVRERSPGASAVWLSESASVAETVAAMRVGFGDIVALPLRPEEFEQRVGALLVRLDSLQRSSERAAHWRQVCRKLNLARRKADRAAAEARVDLDHAKEETRRKVEEAVVSSEFRTLLRQELDVESMLRTAMEYMLTKTGPTNAAVFLDNGDGRWNLAAYVNYRIPRTSIAAALDRIAEEVCPNVAGQEGILRFSDVGEFVESIGPDGEPLADQEVVAFGCRRDDECLAVAVLFRDRREPFPDSCAGLFDLLRRILADQMSSIVRIHHRAKPQWPEETGGSCDEGDWDIAA